MNRRTILSIVILIACAGVVGFFVMNDRPITLDPALESYTRHIIAIGDKKIPVFMADTPQKKAQGLGNFTGIPREDGMLFTFSKPEAIDIWMKDMLFPIDVLWFDENAKLVHIVERMRPDSFPQRFFSEVPALFVLEVNAGFIKKSKIKMGDAFQFIE